MKIVVLNKPRENPGEIDWSALYELGEVEMNARGALIDEEALADALNSDKIYAAGLDAVRNEPIKQDNPLLKAKNCFITPHISWTAIEGRQRLATSAIANVKAFLEGKPSNIVNMG